LILIGLGIYTLYNYLRLESAPVEEETVVEHQAPAGPVATPGVTPHEILIGSSLALGGHASFLGTQYMHGARCLIEEINSEGGIHHRKIRVIAYDDGYDPPRCVANTKRLIEKDKVFALFCYVGTPTSVKIIEYCRREQDPPPGPFHWG